MQVQPLSPPPHEEQKLTNKQRKQRKGVGNRDGATRGQYLFNLEIVWHLTVGRAGGIKGCPGREKIAGKGENYRLEKAGNSV